MSAKIRFGKPVDDGCLRHWTVWRGDQYLGEVTRRQGGWHRAHDAYGISRGSFHHTRAAAAASLVRAAGDQP